MGEYLANWIDTRSADLRPTTLYGYRKVIEKRITPALGHVKLSDLDAASLEAWYGRLLTAGGASGKPLSAKTVANTAGHPLDRPGRRCAAQADEAQPDDGDEVAAS